MQRRTPLSHLSHVSHLTLYLALAPWVVFLQVVDEEELEHEHGELMESILEDEEEIIALHRQQIEDAMEIVRR